MKDLLETFKAGGMGRILTSGWHRHKASSIILGRKSTKVLINSGREIFSSKFPLNIIIHCTWQGEGQLSGGKVVPFLPL